MSDVDQEAKEKGHIERFAKRLRHLNEARRSAVRNSLA
jgi:hypothetical protein